MTTPDQVAFGGKKIQGSQLDLMFERAEAGEVLRGRAGTTRLGRPLAVGAEPATPLAVRLDPIRRGKVERRAKERHTSASQVVRDLIDAM